jgi:pimeloyl-ACP methyl ester carboxylesterase
MPAASYRHIQCPAHILRGENALGPSRLIADELARRLPRASLEILPGAGHMGPFTHQVEVSHRMTRHIQAVEAAGDGQPRDQSIAA